MNNRKDLTTHPAFEPLQWFTIVGALLLLISAMAECQEKQPQAAASSLPTEAEVETGVEYTLPDTCHEETFWRFARPQRIIICVENGFETAVATTTPGDHYMKNRYPAIVDSLSDIDEWAGL